MSSTAAAPAASADLAPQKLRRELGVIETLSLSVAMMSPVLSMAVFAGAPALFIGRAAPLAFILAGLGVGLVGACFVYLTRYYNNAGSVYGLAGSTLGPRSGFFAGWALLLPYMIWTASSAVLTGYFISLFLQDSGIWSSASFLPFALATLVAIYFMASREVKVVGRTLISIEGISILVMGIVLVVIVAKLAGGFHGHHLSTKVFTLPEGTSTHQLILAAVFGVASFAGFEGAASLGEESKNPRRQVPKALAIAIIGAVVLFVMVTTIIAMGFGISAKDGEALGESSGPLFELAREYLSPAFAYILELGAAFSAFSAALATLAGGGRMIYALSRDGRPSLRFAKLGKWGEPKLPLIFVSVLAIILVVTMKVIGTSGLDTAFYFGTIGTLSLIVAYGMVTVAAGRHMVKHQTGFARLWVLLPVAAFAVIAYLMYNELHPAPSSPYNVFPYIVGAWLLVGLVVVVATPGLAERITSGLNRSVKEEPAPGDESGFDAPSGRLADAPIAG